MATKGEKHWGKDEKAKAILECVTLGDAATCKKYSISPRTLQRWHQDFRVGTDAELTASVAEKKVFLDKELASKIPEALSACLDYITRAARSASPDDAEVIHAVAGAMKMIAETDGTYKMIDARISGQAGSDGKATGSLPAGSNVTPIRRVGS
jgi:transposase-like protein